MSWRARISFILTLTAVSASLPGTAAASPSDTEGGDATAPAPAAPAPAAPGPGPRSARLGISAVGAANGKVLVGKKLRAHGRLAPWAPGQQVTVALLRNKRTVKEQVVPVRPIEGEDAGEFKLKGPRLVAPGHYRVQAVHEQSAELGHAAESSRSFKLRYPGLRRKSRGSHVKLFNRLLDREGYVPSHGRRYSARTARAVLAFRKVHGMRRINSATPKIFRRLADGRGAYKLRYPNAGRHVEVSIARQVMVLAKGGRAVRTYAVSTGKSSTPTIRGHYRFYSRQPGFNSLGMYYSVYFIRGYAIHGFASVPNYPASHGCVRTPISDAISIYRWVKIGMSIYTY